MDRKCAICGKTKDLFELELNDDDGKYVRFVCGSCWDVIAGIAQKAVMALISADHAERDDGGSYAEYLHRYYPEKYQEKFGAR